MPPAAQRLHPGGQPAESGCTSPFAHAERFAGFDAYQKLTIDKDAYSSIHFVLLGADHAHVFVGILFNVWLRWKLARGLTTYRANAVQAVTWYWHFVNVLTWVVVLTLTSAALG